MWVKNNLQKNRKIVQEMHKNVHSFQTPYAI